MKMDPITKSLDEKLKLNSISLPQLQDGITECFVLTNRHFLQQRMGEKTPIDEIDGITRELTEQVYAENDITESYISEPLLKKACFVLDKQLGFEADKGLMDHHMEVIGCLFELAA